MVRKRKESGDLFGHVLKEDGRKVGDESEEVLAVEREWAVFHTPQILFISG